MNFAEMPGLLWSLLGEVLASFPRFLKILLRRLRACWIERTRGETAYPCLPIPADVWTRPDAYLYSQRYLMSLGMAVTWDNPDIKLTDLGGAAVGSHDLLPDTEYRVTARIHNRSPDGPAPGLPVVFRLNSFGAGGVVKQAIGTTVIDLPVRAAPGEPASATVVWRTPAVGGHYCIEAEAVWADDAFPPDNLGQHNTTVRHARAGDALHLAVPIFRDALMMNALGAAQARQRATTHAAGPARVRIQLDSYVLPPRPLQRGERETADQLRQRVVAANNGELFAPPAAWGASVSARELALDERGHGEVRFDAVVPPGAAVGSEQRFNVSVRDAETGAAVGGVTVIVKVIA